jgi:hypothetical protein
LTKNQAEGLTACEEGDRPCLKRISHEKAKIKKKAESYTR